MLTKSIGWYFLFYLEPELCGYYKLNYFHINQNDTSNANYQRAKKSGAVPLSREELF